MTWWEWIIAWIVLSFLVGMAIGNFIREGSDHN
jgi:uncharacterized protein YneF (UPF0154 family)